MHAGVLPVVLNASNTSCTSDCMQVYIL